MEREKRRSKKRRKTQTTRAYRKTEREVQQLLFQCIDRNTAGQQQAGAQQLETRSLDFFHAKDVDGVADAESFAINVKDSTDNFIEIELTEPPLVWAQLYKAPHCYDNSFLWMPKGGQLNLPLQSSDCSTMPKRSQARMLNRYQEEARNRRKGNSSSANCKLNSQLIADLTDADAVRFVTDSQLYRSHCSRQFNTVFLAPVPVAQCQGLPVKSCCLKVCLKLLRFTTHPSLLEEHRLAQQLEDLYDLYVQQESNDICEQLREELQIARNVATRLISVNNQPEHAVQLAVHVQRQLELTQQLRKRYYAESTAERSLLQRLLKHWAKLKELRTQQQFQCTCFQLSLRLVPPDDVDASCSAWRQRFETDLAEVYREHLELYYQRRLLWSSGEQSARLKPPRKPQFGAIMDSLKMHYERAFQDPEEPVVHVLRLPNNALTMCPPPGSRNEVRNYYLKLYLDRQFVAQTRCYRLEPDLRVYMNESIGVLLERSLPKQIHIWLYEKSAITSQSRKLALMSSPLTLAKGDSSSLKLEFRVTSGAASPNLEGDLYLHTDYRYTDEDSVTDLDDIQKLPDELKETLLTRKLPAVINTSAEAEATPQPQAPFVLAKNNSRTTTSAPLIFAEQQLQFCGVEELLENRRFQLLHSRHLKRNLYTKQLSFVPALEHELIELKETNGSNGNSSQLLDPGTTWNPIDLHKHRGRKFLQLLYNTIASHCAQRSKLLQTSRPLVQLLGPDGIDQSTAGWSGLWRAFCSLLFGGGVSATMTPPREPAWQPHPINAADQVQQFNISLHVVRATGVPVRSRHIVNVEQTISRRRSSAGTGTGTGSDLSANLFVTQSE
ncbi:GH20756 [Drosophila grimshawi]|uniref:GH20756 n=1 Tax=Drosophila grimshawi TaxID=7222 RepID=B4J6D2_DROGR|nr:GH20756 [Drosophila grimshawi]